jgi:magnesium transporter
MINYYKRDIRKKEMVEIKEFCKTCWVNVVSPDEEEIKLIVDKFRLDKDLVLDGLDIFEIPRFEEESGNSYLYLRIPTFEIENEYTGSFLIVISNNSLITISDKRLELFDRIFKTKKNFFDNLPSRDLVNILSIMSNKFSHWIRKISKDVKKDRKNLNVLNEKDILDLSVQEDILNDYLSSLEPMRNLYKSVSKSGYLKFKESEREFIDDLTIDIDQTISLCISSLKTITNMRDYYSTILSNNRNQILKVLTLFTIFLTIPMVLSGIYGMNIILPFQTHENAFWFLMGSIGFVWIVSILILRKLKIL